MLSYQCFNFRPFGIEKEVNNLLQFLEVMDSFEETSLTVFSSTVLKIAQDISRALSYLRNQDACLLTMHDTLALECFFFPTQNCYCKK